MPGPRWIVRAPSGHSRARGAREATLRGGYYTRHDEGKQAGARGRICESSQLGAGSKGVQQVQRVLNIPRMLGRQVFTGSSSSYFSPVSGGLLWLSCLILWVTAP